MAKCVKAVLFVCLLRKIFSATKQVKLDNPQNVPADKVPILKLNQLQRFETGIINGSKIGKC
jgi:hypothetical protein